jgi:hypothetical protein
LGGGAVQNASFLVMELLDLDEEMVSARVSKLAGVATAKTSAAQDKAACLDAADKGQQLGSAHKLIEARDKFRVCAAAGCPAVVQGDCAGWLDAVEKDLPNVVPLAKDDAGNGLPRKGPMIPRASTRTRVDRSAPVAWRDSSAGSFPGSSQQ